MSDTTGAQPAVAQPAVALPIQIHAQYVKDLSFENPRAPASLQPQSEQPRIEVNVDVQASKVGENDLYEVTLRVTASAPAPATSCSSRNWPMAGCSPCRASPRTRCTRCC